QAPGNAYGNGFFHLLPSFEQDTLYKSSFVSNPGIFIAASPSVYTNQLKVLICPSDPSVGDTIYGGETWGPSCYAGNVQVFADVDSEGKLLRLGAAKRMSDITDGQSTTILFAEKYARCTNRDYPEGGSLWAYWTTGRTWPLHPGFAIDWNQYSTGPDSKFQHRPNPHRGACDPTRASTAHPGGIQVTLADGSVRTLAPGVSGETW